jgi:hypothetical protein
VAWRLSHSIGHVKSKLKADGKLLNAKVSDSEAEKGWNGEAGLEVFDRGFRGEREGNKRGGRRADGNRSPGCYLRILTTTCGGSRENFRFPTRSDPASIGIGRPM